MVEISDIELKIKISVDTTEIDNALIKLKQLKSMEDN